MREWALDRWPEDTQVDLVQELPRLKIDIRLAREAEELRLQQEEEDVLVNLKGFEQPATADTRARR